MRLDGETVGHSQGFAFGRRYIVQLLLLRMLFEFTLLSLLVHLTHALFWCHKLGFRFVEEPETVSQLVLAVEVLSVEVVLALDLRLQRVVVRLHVRIVPLGVKVPHATVELPLRLVHASSQVLFAFVAQVNRDRVLARIVKQLFNVTEKRKTTLAAWFELLWNLTDKRWAKWLGLFT